MLEWAAAFVIHTPPVDLGKSSTGGVCIVSGLAHWTLPYEIITPSEVVLIKMLLRWVDGFQIVLWMQPGRIGHFGKIEFSVALETQVKTLNSWYS